MLRKLKYAVFLLLLGMLLLTLYLSLIGLPDVFARAVEKRLQFSGLAVSLQKVKLGVFEGIIAVRVRCYRRGDIGAALIEADRVVLKLAPQAWLKGQSGIVGALIKKGALRLPVAGQTAQRANQLLCADFNARISWDDPAALLRVHHLDLRTPGVQLTGRGMVALPDAVPLPSGMQNSAPSADGAFAKHVSRSYDLACDWARWILQRGSLTNAGQRINADAEFWVDPSDLNRLSVQARLDARDIGFGKTTLGACGIDLAMHGSVASGNVEIKRSVLEGIYLEHGNGRFGWDGADFTVNDFQAVLGRDPRGGKVNLDAVYHHERRIYEGAIKAAFDPRELRDFLFYLDLSQVRIIEWFDFDEAWPAGTGRFTGGVGSNLWFHMEGWAQGAQCRFNGVSNALIESGFVLHLAATNESLQLNDLLLVRPEGVTRGAARQNFALATVAFDGWSTADPQAVARMVDPRIADVAGRFQFNGPSFIAASGCFGYTNANSENIDIDLDLRKLGWKSFVLDRCRLNLRVLDGEIAVNDAEAELYDGSLSGAGDVCLIPNSSNRCFHAEFEARNLDFTRFVRSLTDKYSEEHQGRLSGKLTLEGMLDDSDGKSFAGHGSFKIAGAHLFQFPIFGGFTEFMSRIVPGLGLLVRQTDARATFVVRDMAVQSDDIVIEGGVIALHGRGRCGFDGALDFNVQVKLLKQHTLAGEIMHLALAPVTKIFEFRLVGTLAEPRWRPAYLPKEMFLIFD